MPVVLDNSVFFDYDSSAIEDDESDEGEHVFDTPHESDDSNVEHKVEFDPYN